MLLITPILKAQNKFESLLEDDYLEINEETQCDWEDEIEELSLRIKEPLNLNSITKESLYQFPFLSDQQIENILAYIYIHGEMLSVYELQLINEIDHHTIELLLPFVCVKPLPLKQKYPSLKEITKYGKHEILTRVDIPFYSRKGYETVYLGPAIYHSLK